MYGTRPQKRLSVLLALATVLVQVAPGAHAGLAHHPQKHTKQQVEDLEADWRSATLGGDIQALDRMLSDDYVGISWTGEVSTKAMQLDHVRTRSYFISRMNVSDMKVKLVGNVAIVTALADVEGSSNGVAMKGLFRYTRVYQRLPTGSWKITNFEVTRASGPEAHTHH